VTRVVAEFVMTPSPSRTWLAASICLVAILAFAILTMAFEATGPLSSICDNDEADGDVLTTADLREPTTENSRDAKKLAELEAAWQEWIVRDVRAEICFAIADFTRNSSWIGGSGNLLVIQALASGTTCSNSKTKLPSGTPNTESARVEQTGPSEGSAVKTWVEFRSVRRSGEALLRKSGRVAKLWLNSALEACATRSAPALDE